MIGKGSTIGDKNNSLIGGRNSVNDNGTTLKFDKIPGTLKSANVKYQPL